MKNLIELQKLKKSYSENQVLTGLDLKIEYGKVTSIIGPNGSGKTTLFKLILGISEPDSGIIIRDPGKSIGFLIEDLIPYERLSLTDNLRAFSLISDKNISRADIKEVVSVSFTEKIKSKTIRSLSAGQKRKALFAVSLLGDPDILILDEPLNSLDLKERIDILSSVRYLKESKNKTILISSHDLASLYEISDIFCFIKNGRVEKELTKKEMSPDQINSVFMELYG
ncbi:MAG: ABC transporter ATP-binding protein [Candidatus Delongbacteria bacterium]